MMATGLEGLKLSQVPLKLELAKEQPTLTREEL